MESTQRHGETCPDELPGEVDGARELVALDADQTDQALAAAAADIARYAVGPNTGIGLVERLQDDLDIRAKHLASTAIVSETIERGERVRRDM
jgi:hypothetical protein